jgi:hypothetical protein
MLGTTRARAAHSSPKSTGDTELQQGTGMCEAFLVGIRDAGCARIAKDTDDATNQPCTRMSGFVSFVSIVVTDLCIRETTIPPRRTRRTGAQEFRIENLEFGIKNRPHEFQIPNSKFRIRFLRVLCGGPL